MPVENRRSLPIRNLSTNAEKKK